MLQYLDRYAEPEARGLLALTTRYRHVVCIPAFAEAADFLVPLSSRLDTAETLFIIVLNAHAGAGGEAIMQTRAGAAWLKSQYPHRQPLGPHCWLLSGQRSEQIAAQRHDILLVERCHRDAYLGPKEGVGKARKIAADIACRLIQLGRVSSPWIHCTDADATLPPDYFAATGMLDARRDSAGLYPFRHLPHADPAANTAQALYDLTLDYYVAGLAWAGSPWAFHTIGSTLVINAQHYARVRGFPVRRAGEDFYLLGKLAKTGAIVTLDSTAIMLETRVSDRVPFGTGPALGKLLGMLDPAAEYPCYNPLAFSYLQCWLGLSATLWQERVQELDEAVIRAFCAANADYDTLDADVLLACVTALGIDKALNHALDNSRSEKVFQRHLTNWFDAFQTLKFIHWLRDNHLPSVPVRLIQDGTCLPFGAVPGRNGPVRPASNQ